MREKALLGALKARERRSFGLGIERLVLHPVDDVGEREHFIEIAVDDGLSRGSDNAQERGVVAEFPLSGANLLRIILVANLGGLWSNRGDNHVEVAR
ncbi:hypothetical protein [Sphingobium sp. IP1]|uniref:hypothetical protein n=1 Tax=Sphingobium sp. IP1 TaxID=2021637 RepID=UPI0015D4F734|nr:hypothetical protein [Sphingobium sp. IP1]